MTFGELLRAARTIMVVQPWRRIRLMIYAGLGRVDVIGHRETSPNKGRDWLVDKSFRKDCPGFIIRYFLQKLDGEEFSALNSKSTIGMQYWTPFVLVQKESRLDLLDINHYFRYCSSAFTKDFLFFLGKNE